MSPWDGWETGRIVVALAALMYAGTWLQLTLMHWAAAFRRWQMIVPVLATPVLVIAALGGVAMRDGILGWLAVGALGLGVIEGLVGLFFHLQGAAAQVGGLGSARNFLVGPPPVLPLAYSLMGVLGLVGMLWNA